MSATLSVPADVRPFANGSEAYDWRAANCDRCTRNGHARGETPCPMEEAVAMGFIVGTVPTDLALTFGATNPRRNPGETEGRGYITMPRQCSQFVPLGRCESAATRSRRRCGTPTEMTVEHQGHTMSACARHRRAYLAAVAAESSSLTTPRTAEG